MNESLLIWGIGLIALAGFVLAAEILIPSGGVLAVTSAVFAISGIVCLFRYDTTWGLLGSLAVMVVGPMLGAFMLKVWPHTPIGRRLINGTESDEDRENRRIAEERERTGRLALVGLTGVATTDLRPVGSAEIGGKRTEVLAEAGWIRAGTPVRVTVVDGSVIKVRQA